MTIAARMIAVLRLLTGVALIDVTTQSGRAALPNGADSLPVTGQELVTE
jgi:hypothetical protein